MSTTYTSNLLLGKPAKTDTGWWAVLNANFDIIDGLFSTASFTSGSVLFANSSGRVAQDNTNLFWDDTNNRLGIGTAAPAYRLDLGTLSTDLHKAKLPSVGIWDTNLNTKQISFHLDFDFTDVRWEYRGSSSAQYGSVFQYDASAGSLIFSNTAAPGVADAAATVIPRWRIDKDGNIGVGGGSFGSGALVCFIANATTAPSTNPTGGGILYCQAGALKYRGSSGTVTTIANA